MGTNRTSIPIVASFLVAATTVGAMAQSPGLPTPGPMPSLVPARTMDEAGATRLTLSPAADWLVTTEGWLWAAVPTGVTRFDGRDGTEGASVPVPGETCLAMDVGFDSVWVGACRSGAPSLVRIDPTTAAVAATIPLEIGDLQYESSVAAGEGAVWAVSLGPDHRLVKVDPTSDMVVATFPVPGDAGDLGGVRAGYAGVWVADPGRGVVLHIDPTDGAILKEIAVGAAPRFMAIGEGGVWAMNEADGTVSRIDPATDSVVATILVTPTRVEGGDIAVGGGSVWARISDQLVARIDPVTNEVVARFGPPAGSGSVAADDAAAWVSAHDVNAVWRLPLH